LTFCFGRARSSGVCATLKSPHIAIGRLSSTSAFVKGRRCFRYSSLIARRFSEDEPDGT
jgi:hypothetical protein